MKVLVTGGAGFIGSAVVRRLVASGHEVCTLDNLSYAGRLESLAGLAGTGTHSFVEGDIRDRDVVARIFEGFRPDGVLHLAAETHVDRSIDDARAFLETNVLGTGVLLDAALRHHRESGSPAARSFRFVHVGTDEVFGSLEPGSPERFDETSGYAPNSPYAASKAGADHLVRAWGRTHGLPVVLTHSTNNYGPRQYPEKLIPLTILNALEGRPIALYGDGLQVRDWLYVEDHAVALEGILERGVPGRCYCIGAEAERTNRAVVEAICTVLDEEAPRDDGRPHAEAIEPVEDRPGHDLRYAIDPGRIREELGWAPAVDFEEGIRRTVHWYLENQSWWWPIRRGGEEGYAGERLGLGPDGSDEVAS